MLPKSNRLRNTADIERVFREGRGIKEGFLFLKLAENNLKVSRFAFVVGKKVSRKAAIRNKLKRALREAVRGKIVQIRPGFDAVVVAQGGAESGVFREAAGKLLKRAKLI